MAVLGTAVGSDSADVEGLGLGRRDLCSTTSRAVHGFLDDHRVMSPGFMMINLLLVTSKAPVTSSDALVPFVASCQKVDFLVVFCAC